LKAGSGIASARAMIVRGRAPTPGDVGRLRPSAQAPGRCRSALAARPLDLQCQPTRCAKPRRSGLRPRDELGAYRRLLYYPALICR
jgi:hypothetical protein